MIIIFKIIVCIVVGRKLYKRPNNELKNNHLSDHIIHAWIKWKSELIYASMEFQLAFFFILGFIERWGRFECRTFVIKTEKKAFNFAGKKTIDIARIMWHGQSAENCLAKPLRYQKQYLAIVMTDFRYIFCLWREKNTTLLSVNRMCLLNFLEQQAIQFAFANGLCSRRCVHKNSMKCNCCRDECCCFSCCCCLFLSFLFSVWNEIGESNNF